MQLICKHCGHVSKSLVVVKDIALAEVMTDFTKHLMSQHNKKGGNNSPFMQFCQDGTMLASVGPTIILLAKHTNLLDLPLGEEDYIQEKFSAMIDQVEEMLGVEVFDNKPNEGRGYDESDKTPRTPNPTINAIGNDIKTNDIGNDLSLPHMT